MEEASSDETSNSVQTTTQNANMQTAPNTPNTPAPTREQIFEQYSTDCWPTILQYPERVFNNTAPKLQQLNQLYGPDTATRWLTMQIVHAYDIDLSKEAHQSVAQRMAIYARDFAGLCAWQNLDTLMLFFALYRAGCIGGSFNAFEPRALGYAYNHDFQTKLKEIHRKLEEKKQQAEIQKKNAARKAADIIDPPMPREKYDESNDFHQIIILYQPNAISILQQIALQPTQWPKPDNLPAYVTLHVDKEGLGKMIELKSQKAIRFASEIE